MKCKLFLALSLFLFVEGHVRAHNPQQASLKLIIQEKGTFIDIGLSQYGIEQALLKKYPDLELGSIEPNAFKELLITYLKQSIRLSVNGRPLPLGTGVIKLGSHQTNLKFVVDDFPENIEYLDIVAPCFQENENQFNFFTVVLNDKNARAKLTKQNGYKSRFTISDSNIAISDFQGNDSFNGVWGLVALSSIATFVLIYRSRKGLIKNFTTKQTVASAAVPLHKNK